MTKHNLELLHKTYRAKLARVYRKIEIKRAEAEEIWFYNKRLIMDFSHFCSCSKEREVLDLQDLYKEADDIVRSVLWYELALKTHHS